jgi:hypothetical protein
MQPKSPLPGFLPVMPVQGLVAPPISRAGLVLGPVGMLAAKHHCAVRIGPT